MLDINGLENPVQLQLLGVHVPAKLVVINSAVSVGVADSEQVARVLVLSRNLERRQAGLDLRVVEVSEVGGVEESEEAADAEVALLLGLPEG